jgi:hypothetical protein
MMNPPGDVRVVGGDLGALRTPDGSDVSPVLERGGSGGRGDEFDQRLGAVRVLCPDDDAA